MAKPFHAQRAGAGPRADATGRQAKAPPGAGPFGLALLCENRRPLRKEVRNEWRPSRGSTFKFTSAPPSFLPSLRDEASGGGAQEQRQWASASLSSSEGLRPHETLRPGEGAVWGGLGRGGSGAVFPGTGPFIDSRPARLPVSRRSHSGRCRKSSRTARRETASVGCEGPVSGASFAVSRWVPKASLRAEGPPWGQRDATSPKAPSHPIPISEGKELAQHPSHVSK